MVEDEKSNPSSSSTASGDEKKVPQPSPAPPTPPAAPAAASGQPLRPVPQPLVRPVPTPPLPPSAPPRNAGRRTFFKLIVALGAVLTLIPFVPWGDYLSHSVGSTGAALRQKVVIDNNTKYGSAAGQPVNVNDLSTFPPDTHWVITYPSSGNSTQDAQNPDTFVKFELIRLPAGELGGDQAEATAFVAFSKVCVHLWCSPNYNPAQGHEDYECPCHGSIYEIPDGKAVAGPASEQPPPTNAIPMLTLTADSTGQLYIEPPVWDVEHNGVIGYGRDYLSYVNYIKPEAEGTGS